jgi:hypothetical protein
MIRKLVVAFLVSVVGLLGAACKKEAGKSCGTEGEAACDGNTSALSCSSGKWTKLECRGPKGCSVSGNLVDCDHSLALTNDACDHEGNFACSVDAKTLLRCASGKFVVDDTCQGGETCKVSANTAGCQ